MKLKIIMITQLLSSCTQNKFSGYVKDFDSNRPIKDVSVSINKITTKTDSIGYFSVEATSNTTYVLQLEREGYATKKVIRKPDSGEKDTDQKTKKDTIYMFKNESDFINNNNR